MLLRNREQKDEEVHQRANARRRHRARDGPVTALFPLKGPGGLVAARQRSGWFSTLETDQGSTVTVEFPLDELFHFVASEGA